MEPTAYNGTTTEQHDNNGKAWHFRFDDAEKMSQGYILLMT